MGWWLSMCPSFPGPHITLDPSLTIIIKLVTMQQCVTKPPVMLYSDPTNKVWKWGVKREWQQRKVFILESVSRSEQSQAVAVMSRLRVRVGSLTLSHLMTRQSVLHFLRAQCYNSRYLLNPCPCWFRSTLAWDRIIWNVYFAFVHREIWKKMKWKTFLDMDVKDLRYTVG